MSLKSISYNAILAHGDVIREISRNRSFMRGINIACSAGFIATAATTLVGASHQAKATDFNAGVMMDKMDARDRIPFVMGIIEGLAYARFARDNDHVEGDKKTTVGMMCVYNWYYEKPHAIDMIYEAFGKYPTYPPGAIISSLIKQDCG